MANISDYIIEPLKRGKLILSLQPAIRKDFTHEEWQELGLTAFRNIKLYLLGGNTGKPRNTVAGKLNYVGVFEKAMINKFLSLAQGEFCRSTISVLLHSLAGIVFDII